ncbi:MAG: FliG C-terminal domain-containing protein, partial [bacterium]|nr:FliG C-terminal domain-containing protein [bacterium]
RVPLRKLQPFQERIRILFLRNVYEEGQEIHFMVLNHEYEDFHFYFTVIDDHDFIYAFDECAFSKTMPYRDFRFRVRKSNQYRLLFYINDVYQFSVPLKILKTQLCRRYLISRRSDKSVSLTIPGLEPQDIRVRYTGLNNFKPCYDTAESILEQDLEELYVPVNKIFKNTAENDIFRYFRRKPEGKYNPAGILKIINLLKFMPDKEEVQFMQNLLQEDRDLALYLLDNIFDFDLIFLLSEEYIRDILASVIDQDVAIALKGETHDRSGFIRKHLSEFRWKNIDALSGRIESIEMDKVNEVQRKIGTFVRSFFQQKMGIPFVFSRMKVRKFKIREFSASYDNGCEVLLPEFRFNGDYLMQVETSEGLVQTVIRIRERQDELKFTIRMIHQSRDFFDVLNVDAGSVFLRFFHDLRNAQVVLFTGENDFKVFDFTGIHQDEIIQVPYTGGRSLRLLIGALYKDKKHLVDEADLVIDTDEIRMRDFFLPDSVLSGDPVFIKKIKTQTQELLYIHQQEIPLSLDLEGDKDLIGIQQKIKASLEKMRSPVMDLDVMEIEDLVEVRNRIADNGNLFTLYSPAAFHIYLVFSLGPVAVRLSGDMLCFYNFTDSPFSFKLIADQEAGPGEEVTGKYHEHPSPPFKRNLKVDLSTALGDISVYFPAEGQEEQGAVEKYALKGEDLDGIQARLLNKRSRTIIDLIQELKVYYFKFRMTKQKLYYHLMRAVMKNIRENYFLSRYFIFTPESGFSLLDVVEILLHLHELYRTGWESLDSMVDKTFEYMKALKIKNKRLDIYKKKK